jgi:hypothetical protein
MKPIGFSWDDKKNITNLKKHGVSFEEAQSVFFDENALQFFDESTSETEDRFLMLGLSSHLRILIVVHTFKKDDSIIRIISARKATRNETRVYSERKQ